MEYGPFLMSEEWTGDLYVYVICALHNMSVCATHTPKREGGGRRRESERDGNLGLMAV